MNNKRVKTKAMAMAVAAAMAVDLCPVTAFAVTGEQVAADGKYSSTTHVTRTVDDEEDEWNEYDVTVDLTVKDGKFENITVTPGSTYVAADNASYFNKAYNKSKGIKTLLEGQPATESTINSWNIDAISQATRVSTAVKEAALEAIHSAAEKQEPAPVEIDTTKLETAIAEAEGKTEADYTADSWKLMQDKLTAAKAALEAKTSQEEVTKAAGELDEAVQALVKAETKEEYKYVYAALSYQEYWSAEGVQAAGDGSSSDVKDTHAEYDKGAFDAVTRATTNHGLHRGNFQQDVTIYDTDGNAYDMAYWDGQSKIVLTDGTSIGFSKGTITLPSGETKTMATYKIKGIKYVPVQVAAEDYEAFKEKYTVVENGETLAGGYSEGQLSSYSGLVADVDANTNGLKKATKNADGSFSFGKRQTGTGSGIQGVALQSTNLTPVVQETSSYGDFIRMDVKENYGEVGAKMQTVVWTYYGDGDTPLATYGTKFAADNWMHKSNGIQLGLTDSMRCSLPAGKDGTGKWTVTIYALGYADTTMTINVTADDIHAATPVSDTSKLEAAVAKAEALNKEEYTEDSWSSLETELNEAKADLTAAANGTTSQESVDESTSHLNAAIEALVKKAAQEEYKYVYAAMTWAEYWAAEDVQAAGDSTGSEEKDTRGESDKGAFDTVTRATTNHGLHRGSYQCTATIKGENGKSYAVAYWTDRNTAVLTDGSSIGFNGGTITEADGTETTMKDYEVTGLKYVPVKVAASDYEAFCEKYTVVENGKELAGGFSEGNLSSYAGLTANVTADTNGLKTVSQNADGTFSFSARQKGSESGITGQALKTAPSAEDAGLTVKEANGSFGEFLRVDLNKDYGDLGANMQAVTWTYYGDDSTYTDAKAVYGTKFAADNWMHSKQGIQLGLTDSLRCTLPKGTDGTGYWTITIAALGYEDVTYQFRATDENIVKPDPDETISTDALEAAIAKAEALTESDYTADSWAVMQTELQEAKDELKAPKTQATVDEAVSHLNAAVEALVKVQKETYVLMNIPYDQFYKADVNNDVKVDAFTSATKNKVKTGSLAGGSYHVDSTGDEITGVTFPVKVPAGTDLSKYTQITDESKVSITVTNRGQTSTTDYEGKDALFESASYSYYTLSEVPSYYKELTVNADGSFSFGATQGTVTKITEGVDADLMTESSYGDYQLDLDGLTDTIPNGTAIYGVIVSTKEGSDYGMRHLENIWRVSELAWATGFTTAVHNCPTSSEHYKAIMGQHINKVTYYTANGIYEIPVGGEEGLYVPVKFDTSKAAVADAELKDGETSVATTISGLSLPDGFDAEYTVDGADVTVKGEKLILKNVKKGAYTLNVADKSGTYAPLSIGFEVYTDTMPAAYNENSEKPGLTKAAGSTDAEFADFLKNITSVSVNGTSYAASGRGAVQLFNEDGTLITDAAPFAEGDSFAIVVTATGYKDLSFTYNKKAADNDPTQEISTASLEKAIQTAEALKEADYTADSWKVLQTALKNAKSVLEEKKDQETVDNAATSLNKAIEALMKAEATTPTPTPSTTPAASNGSGSGTASGTGSTGASGSKTSTATGTTSTSKSAKTGDPTNIMEMLGLAISSLGAGGFALKRRKRNKK